MDATDKELTYTVADEEYQDGLAKGWTDDDMLKPGVYRTRRARFVAKTSQGVPVIGKVKISLYLDADILEYFRAGAEPANAAAYQTQINNELRRIMESDRRETVKVENEILNDTAFLRALKEKLATI